jgi:hypothetical protein
MYLKKIGHWLLFLLAGYFITRIILVIIFFLPIYAFAKIYYWGVFWFLLTGIIFLTIFYNIVIGLMGRLFEYMNEKKPDYWFSSIFLSIVTITFFYEFIEYFESIINDYSREFRTFKGIMFIISIFPSYLMILFFSIISPFLIRPKKKELVIED